MDLPELVEGGRVALRRRGVRQAHPAELGGVGAVAPQLRVHLSAAYFLQLLANALPILQICDALQTLSQTEWRVIDWAGKSKRREPT